jgi:hypothetical protein
MDKNPGDDDLCLLELKVSPIFRSLEMVKLHQIPKVLLFSLALWAHASHSIPPPPRLLKVVLPDVFLHCLFVADMVEQFGRHIQNPYS